MARRGGGGLLGGYIGGIPVGLIVGAGVVWWFFIREKPPTAEELRESARKQEARKHLQQGWVKAAVPGVTISELTGEPLTVPGETTESAMKRWEAWGLATGMPYPIAP